MSIAKRKKNFVLFNYFYYKALYKRGEHLYNNNCIGLGVRL